MSGAPPPAPTPGQLRDLLAALPPIDERALLAESAEAGAGIRPTRGEVERAITLLDLTSLAATDSPTTIRALAQRARRPDPDDPRVAPVAAVCTWPDLVPVAVDAVAGSDVRVAAVAGAFPSARSPLPVRVAEVEAAVAAGADEIDLVIDRAALAEDRPGDALEQLVALRRACGPAACKVILETGSLPDAAAIRRAGWIAVLAGADWLKTSTGKDDPGASPAAVRVLLDVAREHEHRTGRPVGVKVSGGVRSTADALGYLRLAVAGDTARRVAADRLRIGASSLLDALVASRRELP